MRYIFHRILFTLDLLRDLLQIGLLLTKYSTSSSFILEIQSNAWLCYINLCRRRQWWWKQNKEQGNNEHVFTVISRYSQHRCHTGANKIPKHSEHLIWLFYNDLHLNILIYVMSHPPSVYLRTYPHSWRMGNQEQNMNDLNLHLHLNCLTSSDLVK